MQVPSLHPKSTQPTPPKKRKTAGGAGKGEGLAAGEEASGAKAARRDGAGGGREPAPGKGSGSAEGGECPGALDCLGCQLDVLFGEMAGGEVAPFAPHALLHTTWRSCARLAAYGQQDAHDFFMAALDALHSSSVGYSAVAAQSSASGLSAPPVSAPAAGGEPSLAAATSSRTAPNPGDSDRAGAWSFVFPAQTTTKSNPNFQSAAGGTSG
jgi:hypothetical protein